MPRSPANAKLRDDLLAYAAKTSLSAAARHYGIEYNTARQWAWAARQAAMTDTPEAETLAPPPEPEVTVEAEGVAEPTWTPLEVKHPPKVEIVARTVDSEAQAALMACFTRIRNAAATAPLKEVIRAAQVTGELILAANVTNQSLARKLADRLDGR